MSLLEEYKEWCNEPENASPYWYQQRGYAFEKIINRVMERDGLNPRSSYKIKGEQIDGSFVLGDRVYLLEAKWHKKEMAASNIYEFKGKVDGKLTGTLGVFISISGFSKDSIEALIYGKEINIILFDRKDFEYSLEKVGAFKHILIEKLRVAAEQGAPMYPIDAIKQEERLLENAELLQESDCVEVEKFTIICEGRTDKALLSILGSRITDKEITIIEALGSRNIPLVANKILEFKQQNDKLILIADSDGNESKVQDMFEQQTQGNDWEFVIINDTIEDWFMDTQNISRKEKRKLFPRLTDIAKELDISKLRKKVQSFDKFCSILESKS